MKVLYVYDKMPNEYEKYISVFFDNLKNKINVKTLVYEKNKNANYNIISYGYLDLFQRLLYKLSISSFKSSDIKIMNEYDIVHVQYSYLFLKILPLLTQKKRPKIIVTLRGGDTYIKPWVSERWIHFYKNYGDAIDAFIVMSNNQKEYLLKWGISENKVHVIPISFGHESAIEPKLPNDDILKIVSAYRMTWEKNIEGSVRFAKLLKERNIPFVYDIYGDGSDWGQLYYLIDKFGLKENVFVKGKVKNSVIKENLSNYDFYFQISLSEALPTSVLEAQSFGLPCVVSNSGGLPEAIIPNKTGICSDYYDIDYFVNETIKLWKDKERYHQFSKDAITFANENFTIAIEIKKTRAVYDTVLNK